MTILVRLVLAHLLGDFVFQPGSWVRIKEVRTWRTPLLYLHALIHGVLSLLLVWDIRFWPWALVIAVTHALIDILKLTQQREATKRIWFFVDQLMHLVVIALVWWLWLKPLIPLNGPQTDRLLIILTTWVFLLKPASFIIRNIISKWEGDALISPSLQNAGNYIGYLERTLVLLFLLTGHWEGVGFLLAAKSIFRFGDLRNRAEVSLTEYILIGTLLSFTIALVASLVAIRLLHFH